MTAGRRHQPVDRQALKEAVGDLLYTRPGRGLRMTMRNSFCCLSTLALTFYFVNEPPIFIAMCIFNGFLYAAVMTTTHDAIHHTLTGWRYFDEIAPRCFAYCIFWPHGIYAEIHKLHHKMNGRDLRDPERPTPTKAEYDRAPGWKKFYFRHQWFINLFILGGFGMLGRHIYEAWRLKDSHPDIIKAAKTDLKGIGFCLVVTLALILYFDVFWEYVIYFLIMERILGFFHQMRSHIEHYGIWREGEHQLEVKLLNCRNVQSNKIMRWFFNGLNYHSVHHAYPAIPFYNLKEAHHRLAKLYNQAGNPMEEERSYWRSAVNLARSPRYI